MSPSVPSLAVARMPAAWRIASLLASFIALLACACTSIPKGRSAIDSIEFTGNESIDGDDLEEQIASAESPRFLGLFRGLVYDYEVFDRFVLQRDLQRIVRYYRARGFYETKVRAGRIVREDPQHVHVTVEIDEGPRTYVRKARLLGLAGLEPDVQAAARSALETIGEGKPFDESAYEKAEADIRRVLTDRGYAVANVQRTAHVDLPRHDAEVQYTVDAGPKARLGKIRLEGLESIPEDRVRRALMLEAGDPYSTEELDAARQALLDLGVFASVELVPELPEEDDGERTGPIVIPLVVKLEPADLRTLRLGGGAELDVIRAGVHLLAGWESRNFLGGLRRFSVEFRPGLVFYPTRIPTFDKPTHFLPEERFQIQLEQPGFIEGRTTGFVRGDYDIFPVLFSNEVDPLAPVIGFREARGSVGVFRKFGRLLLRPSENVQWDVPFAYAGTLDPDLRPAVISYVELVSNLDLRDDPVQPHHGLWLGNRLQVAGVGGDTHDVKLEPSVRGYVPMGKRLTLALRGTVGFLFPFNYGTTLDSNARVGQPPEGVDRAAWVRDSQLVFLRAFFSGGPNSNRGYPPRGVGPHGSVPFLTPNLAVSEIGMACARGAPELDARCSLPLGGLSLWEASAEFRYQITEPLSAALFCDASDVSQERTQLRFTRPHLSCGLGARYGTPVGPIRLDIGYRIPGLQALRDDVPPSYGNPGTIAGLPLAINVAVGEMF